MTTININGEITITVERDVEEVRVISFTELEIKHFVVTSFDDVLNWSKLN